MKLPRIALLAVTGLAVVAAGAWTAGRILTSGPPDLVAGVLLPQPRALSAFSLTDESGVAFTPGHLQGRWTLLFAGFTHCPDVCPTTLGLFRDLERSLQAESRALQTVFLSVDPQRDAPARLEQYVRFFSPTLKGVTGTPEQLERLCAELGIAFVKVPGGGADDYNMDHSAALVLIDPHGRVAGYFPAPHDPAALLSDLRAILPASA